MMTMFREMPEFPRPMMDLFGTDMMRTFFPDPARRMPPPPARGFRVDVSDKGDHWELKADLPGVKAEDIEITAKEDVLTIRADFGTEEKAESNGFTHIERRRGQVQRTFRLEGIDQNAIAATHVDGVLTLTLPRLKERIPEVRHIAVNAAASAPALEAPAQ